jgi:hypothetical protein
MCTTVLGFLYDLGPSRVALLLLKNPYIFKWDSGDSLPMVTKILTAT